MNVALEAFKKVAKAEGITITALEASIGASKGVLSRAIKNDTDIQAKWLIKLVENYPQYPLEDLLNLPNRGPLSKRSALNSHNGQYPSELIENLQTVINAQSETIQSQRETIETLKIQMSSPETQNTASSNIRPVSRELAKKP